MSRFITYPIPVDARDLIAKAFAYMQTKNPNWEPSEGQPDTWIIEATGSEGADIGTLASQVPKSIYRNFGQQLFGIAPIDLQSATVSIDIYAVDSLGHTIPANTHVAIADALGNLIAFYTLSDAVIAPGATHVDNVLCVASIGGAQGTGLGSIGGVVTLLDAFSAGSSLGFVDHITQVAVTVGGQDAETDDAYLDRLSLEVQTMSPRPILAGDFSILARNIARVQRATTLDGYDPGTDTFGNERMVTTFGQDAAGLAIDAPTKTLLQTYLDAMREVNFVVNVADLTVNLIDVTTHFTVLPTYDLSDVQNRVYAAIQQYLNAALWGLNPNDDPNDPKTWNNQNVIYYLELASVVNNVPGVNIITSLTLGIHGGGLAAADLAMTGRVPVPNPNTITVVGSY